MAVRSVYAPHAAERVGDGILPVDGEEHRHLAVSRVRTGEQVEVFDGRGNIWKGEVVENGRDRTRIRLGEMRMAPPRETEIVLAQALIQKSAFDRILEKAVELGVSRIIPFRAERSNETGGGRERRWRRIAVEATKQSKQYRVPRVDAACALDQILDVQVASRIVFCEKGNGNLKAALTGSPVMCIIGPEGGWTDFELRRMMDAGFRQAHLGHQILRADTAAIVALSLVAYETGAL